MVYLLIKQLLIKFQNIHMPMNLLEKMEKVIVKINLLVHGDFQMKMEQQWN